MTSNLSESLSAMNLTSDTRRPRIQNNNKNNNTLLDETRGNVANARNELDVTTKNKSLLNISIGEAVIGNYVLLLLLLLLLIYSHLASPSPHESKRARQVVPTNSTMDMTHIQDHYMECIRLSTENKINSKNAFLLKLNSLTSAETWTSEGETDFKMAGMAIDASAKIYAGRVDSVHHDTYSVLGSLGTRRGEKEGEATAGEEESKKEGKTENEKTKKKEKKKSFLTTAENLKMRDFEPQRVRNPILEKLAAASDIGGVNGMLMFQLPMQERYFQFEIDFSQPYPAEYVSPWNECQHQEGSACVKELFELWDSIDHSPAPICPELEGFEFNDDGKFVKVSREEEESDDMEP